MGRILILAIIGILAWLLLRGLFKSASKSADRPQVKSDDIVPCGVCGVHIPKSEAQFEDGAWRCRDRTACTQRKP